MRGGYRRPLIARALLLAHVADPVFDVPPGGDDAIAEQRWLPGQERDRGGVLIDVVMEIIRMSGQDRAHEARALTGPLHVSCSVKRYARRLRALHQGIIAPARRQRWHPPARQKPGLGRV
jgi:hypothetical protein